MGLYLVAFLIVTAGMVTGSCGQAPPASLERVIIIRHGEKPPQGDNLSCQGLNRSLQLPSVLYKKIGLPSAIYVPTIDQGKSTDVARMYQTIVPFAIKYNLKISTKYEVDDTKGLAAAIQKHTGTVLVVWEHKAAGKILRALGLEEKQKWPDEDFDSIWIVTYKNGVPTLTKEAEGLHPTDSCP